MRIESPARQTQNGVVSRVGSSTPHTKSGEHRERFDPRGQAGKLIDAEHHGRYWWAAQAALGKEVLDAGCGVGYGLQILASAGAATVTGVDIDEEAIGETRKRFGDTAEAIVQADLRDLPLADESFDLIVCFETIEHLEDGERALAELRRVLRPDGLLLISSPNPDVYPPGNEHHVHEYRPAELAAVLGERFANLASYRQHPWLAAAIEPTEADAPARLEVRTTARLEPGGETYSIHAASDAELPDLDGLLVLGADFEVGWWAGQVEEAKRRAEEEVGRARAQSEERLEAAEALEREARKQIAAAEERARAEIVAAESRAKGQIEAIELESRRSLAQAAAREAEARARLQETASALLEANQSLAMLPTLQHRHEEQEALRAHVEILEGSRSWRYLAPLRRLWRFLGLRR